MDDERLKNPLIGQSVVPDYFDEMGQVIERSSVTCLFSKSKKPAIWLVSYIWCPDSESNQGHGDFQSPALPTELSGRTTSDIKADKLCKVNCFLTFHLKIMFKRSIFNHLNHFCCFSLPK